MRLYFRRSDNRRKFLCRVFTKEDAIKAISNFLDQHYYKSYYTRTWREGDEVWIDVGSWSEFFVVEDEDGEWGEI